VTPVFGVSPRRPSAKAEERKDHEDDNDGAYEPDDAVHGIFLFLLDGSAADMLRLNDLSARWFQASPGRKGQG
jgi:hypothetical protein